LIKFENYQILLSGGDSPVPVIDEVDFDFPQPFVDGLDDGAIDYPVFRPFAGHDLLKNN
jgi:hypothetical protein